MFKQKKWLEVDAIEASLECGSEDSYPSRSDTTPSNSVDLPGSVVLSKLNCAIFAGNTADQVLGTTPVVTLLKLSSIFLYRTKIISWP